MANISNLVIEVTRRCNMNCAHCLRGKAQSKDMTDALAYKIFSQLDHVKDLTLTGGEPSLVPERIINISRNIRYTNASVDHFYIASNAKKITDEFIQSLRFLAMETEHPDHNYIEISTDKYHGEFGSYQEGYNKLVDAYETDEMMCRVRQRSPELTSILHMGNAIENGLGDRTNDPDTPIIKKEYGIISWDEGLLYITVDGDILTDCDVSYDKVDDRKIANINDEGFTLNNFIEEYATLNDLWSITLTDYEK